jgi:hypothetical protein
MHGILTEGMGERIDPIKMQIGKKINYPVFLAYVIA